MKFIVAGFLIAGLIITLSLPRYTPVDTSGLLELAILADSLESK